MTKMTRREMLRASALAAGGGGPLTLAGPAAIAAACEAVFSGADPAVLGAVSEWRRTWELASSIETHLHDHPTVDGQPTAPDLDLAWPRRGALFDDARVRLDQAEPHTLAEALAVLDCAVTVITNRQRARADPGRDGTIARRLACHGDQGEDGLVLAAHRALRRLWPVA